MITTPPPPRFNARFPRRKGTPHTTWAPWRERFLLSAASFDCPVPDVCGASQAFPPKTRREPQEHSLHRTH